MTAGSAEAGVASHSLYANGSSNGSFAPANAIGTQSSNDSESAQPQPQQEQPKKVDVSHFPHYGLKRGMACTFCRRRKLRCSGDRPQCTNCVKYTKQCEYGPPVKSEKKKKQQEEQQRQQQQQQQQRARQQLDPSYSNAGPSMGQAAVGVGVPPLSQPPPSSMYCNDHLGGSTDFMNTMLVDSGMLPANTFPPPETHHFGMDAFGSDFEQQSAFVSPPQQETMLGQPPHNPHNDFQHMAQPIIGMPPYVPPVGPEYGFTSMQAASAAMQQQQHQPPPEVQHHPQPQPQQLTPEWVQNQAPYPTPQNSASNDGTPGQPHRSATIVTDSFTTEPMFDPSMCAPREYTSATITQIGSDQSTPEAKLRQNTSGRTSRTGTGSGRETPDASNRLASRMYQQTNLTYVADLNPVDGLTERLGEFLFSPAGSAVPDEDPAKRRKPGTGISSSARKAANSPASLARVNEHDGLMDASRTLLLDCFLAHSSLFFEMSVPRFRYRLTFADRRRPSLALLNSMYLWATRISNSPQMVSMEKYFFEQACKHLDISASTVDRLIDAVRSAMLLSAYSHSSGRHHEGWCLAGLANRLVLSCGLHRIKSNVHKPEDPPNPFLRERHFLLPPPEDAVELGERIHAFWAVFATDRCGSLATGYPSGLRDEDIITPFGRHLADIASGSVSERDDITVKDLYLGRGGDCSQDTPYTKWAKCVTIIERAGKICYLDPAEDSAYAQAWNQYHLTLHRDPNQVPPSEALNQPKFRNPRDYRECLLAVETLISGIGEEGVFPLVRIMHAKQDGAPEPIIPTNIIMLHHLLAAIHMLLNDINSLDAENPEALRAARKSVLLFRGMPPIPFTDVDAFVVLVWSMIAKVLVKEVHRLTRMGDADGARAVAAEADTVIGEMSRIGQTMYIARTQAKAVEELKQAALSPSRQGSASGLPHLDAFMFPQSM